MLEDKIKKAIEEDLPKQVGDALVSRLKQADADESNLKSLQIKYDNEVKNSQNWQQRYVDTSKQFDIYKTDYSRLVAREEEVASKELTLELTLVTVKLEEANKRADMVQDFTSGLVRNTTFRKTVWDSEDQAAFVDAQGMTQYPAPINKKLNETSTKE